MPAIGNYALNRRRYLEAKRNKWALLKGTALLPLEKSVVEKALRVVLRNGVGAQRTPQNNVDSISVITKILIEKTVRAPEKIPAKDREIFLELMQWFLKEYAFVGSVLPAKKIAQRMDPSSLSQFTKTIEGVQKKFMIDNKDRWWSNPNQSFEQLLEFQLKHDIHIASSELSQFLFRVERS